MTRDPAKHKVLIVDDHPVLRQGLITLINQEKDLTVCGDVGESQEALGAIKTLKPDLAVVDISLQKASGIELTKEIGLRYPNLLVLVLSIHDEAFYAERALRAGAKGYVMKQEAPQTIVKAIRQVLRGEIYLSETMAKKMLRASFSDRGKPGGSAVERLTDRELQVFKLMGKGLSTSEIAEEISLSVKTIESHNKNMRTKLQLENSMKLRQFAIQWARNEPTE